MTLKELIQRATDIASQGLDEGTLTANPEEVAEPLLPIVFSEVSHRYAQSEQLQTMLRRTKSLVFANGLVALSSDVITGCIRAANLLDPADRTKLYSYVPWSQLVTGSLDSRLGYFALEGESTLHVVESNTTFDPADGPNITLELTIPCEVEVPTVLANPIVARDEIVDDLLAALATALKPVIRR